MSSLKQLAVGVGLPISIGGISLYLATHHYGEHHSNPGDDIEKVEIYQPPESDVPILVYWRVGEDWSRTQPYPYGSSVTEYHVNEVIADAKSKGARVLRGRTDQYGKIVKSGNPSNPMSDVEKQYCKMLEEAIADEVSAEAFYVRMLKLAENLPADKRIWADPLTIARVADDEKRHGNLWKQQKEYLCEK